MIQKEIDQKKLQTSNPITISNLIGLATILFTAYYKAENIADGFFKIIVLFVVTAIFLIVINALLSFLSTLIKLFINRINFYWRLPSQISRIENDISQLIQASQHKNANKKEEYEWVSPVQKMAEDLSKQINDNLYYAMGYVKRKRKTDK